jgi:hypothetical protein
MKHTNENTTAEFATGRRSALGHQRTFRSAIGMSALGHKRTFAVQYPMSALPPKADMCGAARDVRFGSLADILVVNRGARFTPVKGPIAEPCVKLFDHLISEKQKRLAYGETESFSRFEIDDEFEFVR